jgi:hypothetical protein
VNEVSTLSLDKRELRSSVRGAMSRSLRLCCDQLVVIVGLRARCE